MTVKFVEGWDELSKTRKDLEFKKENGTKFLVHDRQQSLGMMLRYSVTVEDTAKQKCVHVLTTDVQARIAEHSELLPAISGTAECSELAA